MLNYEDLGVQPLISAQANSTPLGGCTLSEGVIAAMADAARSHVEIAQLWRAAGRFISEITGSDDACPVTGAAAGMAISVAACVAGTDPLRVQRLPDHGTRPNEVILKKGHSISYGGAPISQMIAMGGGRVVEVGSVNSAPRDHFKSAITENTAAVVYVTSHTHAVHSKGVGLNEMISFAREAGIPFIIDAAGESDLKYWVGTGADLVIYSGPKMLGAPTSGFICGNASLIEACRTQYDGIGRPMKVGKENLMGLLQAVREYTAVTESERAEAQKDRMSGLAARIDQIPGLTARVTKDISNRKIYRVTITVDTHATGISAQELVDMMAVGSPAIYLRDFKVPFGQVEIDPRALNVEQENQVANKLEEVLLELVSTKIELNR